MKIFFTITLVLFLFSCSSRRATLPLKSGMIKNSSVFANADELGISKAVFISKYGKPINKDLKSEGTNLVESLYYVESIDEVLVTTKIKFLNDRVVEQSTFKIEYNTDKRLKELNEEVRRTKLRAFMNQN